MSEAAELENTESPVLEGESSPEKEAEATAEIVEELEKEEIDPDQFHGLTRKVNKQKRDLREARQREADLREQLAKAQVKPAPKAEDYDTDEAYIEATVDHKLAQSTSKPESYNPVEQVANDLRAEGPKKYEDFNQVAFATQEMLVVLDEFDAPEDIVYFLGQNRDVAERIDGMSNTAMAREFGKIEAKLNQPKPLVTKTPEPVKPLESTTTEELDDDNLTTEQWADKRNKERWAKGKI